MIFLWNSITLPLPITRWDLRKWRYTRHLCVQGWLLVMMLVHGVVVGCLLIGWTGGMDGLDDGLGKNCMAGNYQICFNNNAVIIWSLCMFWNITIKEYTSILVQYYTKYHVLAWYYLLCPGIVAIIGNTFTVAYQSEPSYSVVQLSSCRTRIVYIYCGKSGVLCEYITRIFMLHVTDTSTMHWSDQ